MIGFTEKGISNFVVGEFYIVDLDQKKPSSAYIIKNEHTYKHYADSSEENKATLDKLDSMKAERPFEWGVYEDWQTAVDLNLSPVTEAVARQYQALDYILGTNKDTGTALYMLRRIENSYKNFLIAKRTNGDVAAHNYLETYRIQGLKEHRMSVYYARLLQRVMSEIPLCTQFFQEDRSHVYISYLTRPQGFMKGARIKKHELTLDDVLLEYLKSNEEDPESLDFLQGVDTLQAIA